MVSYSNAESIWYQTMQQKSIEVFIQIFFQDKKKKIFTREMNHTLISTTNFVAPFGNLQGLGFVSCLETNTNISQIFGSGK